MSRFAWLTDLMTRCNSEQILLTEDTAQELAPAQVLNVIVADWGRFAKVAKQQKMRWCAVWALQQDEQNFLLNSCFEKEGDYLVLRTIVDSENPLLPSQTPVYPAANRPERHIQDMYGITFNDHPDQRRWTRHVAWSEKDFPLRKNFSAGNENIKKSCLDNHQIPAADSEYPFIQAQGAAVYEIPVGPVHAGIIEPGHFRFLAVGEHILNLEERLGYVHKGIEKIAEGRDPDALSRLAGRISGDSTVAHSWAACVAMERAAKIKVPERAQYIRAILAERERVANHLGDIGGVCNDVGFAFANIQFSRLREIWQRTNMSIFQHRMLMDIVTPGGVKADFNNEQLDELQKQHRWLRDEVTELMEILDNNISLEDRLLATGVLSVEIAEQLGVVGYVAKASGIDLDIRRDHAYAPYDQFKVESPCFHYGDVASRVRVRAEEIYQSLTLMQKMLNTLPQGEYSITWKKPAEGAEGIGMVEGWRGEIISYVRFDDAGNISRFYSRDPSWLNWPAMEHLIHGNIVPDFPVCNKSVNGSYSGHDL